MEEGLVNTEGSIEVADKIFVIAPNDTVLSYVNFYSCFMLVIFIFIFSSSFIEIELTYSAV